MRVAKLFLTLIAVFAFVAFGILLESATGIPFDTTYRIACAGMCLGFMAMMAREHPGARWSWIALLIAATTNAALFLTPMAHHPASRGEVMILALPDATIYLTARAMTLPATDVHERAVRQQVVVGAILAYVFSALIIATLFIPDRVPTRSDRNPPMRGE